MPDLHDRFRALDSLRSPVQWHEIEVRSTAIPRPSSSSLVPALSAGVILIAVALGAAGWIRLDGGSGPLPVSPPVGSPSVGPSASGSTPLAGTWTNTGSMATPLDGPPVLLADGRVLVAGGHQGPAHSSAEVYEPTTGSWAATGSMIEARRLHTATLLPDGRILVAGGSDPTTALASAELYDPRTGSWTATGSMVEPRALHTATLLPNGTVLVTGGLSVTARDANAGAGFLASAELYDPSTASWSATQPMTDGRAAHTATLLTDGWVLVAGGEQSQGRAPRELASAELYDPRTGSWIATGSMLDRRAYHRAVLLPDGNVLVVGGWSSAGSSAEVYGAGSGSWASTGKMVGAQWGATATVLPDGMVLMAGGADCNGDPCFTSRAQLYDLSAGWTETGSLLGVRKFHSATLLLDGTVLVTGGSDKHSGTDWHRLSTAELYHPALGKDGQ